MIFEKDLADKFLDALNKVIPTIVDASNKKEIINIIFEKGLADKFLNALIQ